MKTTEYRNSRRIVYLEIVRIAAVLLVILNHIDINYLYYHDTDNLLTFTASLIVTVLCRCDVPLFFMVSGALLLSREESPKQIIGKRVPRIIGVIVLFSAAQYAFQTMRGKLPSWSAADFLRKLLEGSIQETYWFLYAYLGFLLLLPLLQAASSGITRERFRYLTVLCLGLEFAVPFVNRVLNLSISRELTDTVSKAAGIPFYAIAGYYLHTNREKLDSKAAKSAAAVFAAATGIPYFSELIPFLRSGSCQDAQIGSLTTAVTLSVYVLIYCAAERRGASSPLVKAAALGRYVFGVYLSEQFVRAMLIDSYREMIQVMPGVIASLIYWGMTATVSFALSCILCRLPLLNKLI